MTFDQVSASRLGRLLDALTDEILNAPDGDVLAGQAPGRAGAAAASLRSALRRAVVGGRDPAQALGFRHPDARPGGACETKGEGS